MERLDRPFCIYYYAPIMKYQLETIPIWDAYEEESECPLCLLEEKAETDYIRFFLGNSIMNPEMRVEVNKTGFCPRHYGKLWETRDNRHGLSLMTHTYLTKQRETIDKKLAVLQRKTSKLPTLNKKGTLKTEVEKVKRTLREIEISCMICSRIENRLNRYAFSIVYLWKKDEEFRRKVKESKGFCLHHLPLIMDMALEVLPGKKCAQWITMVMELEKERLRLLEDELFQLTQTYVYSNAETSWEKYRFALPNVIQKMTGKPLHE